MRMQSYHERVKKLLPGGVHYNFNLPWEESPLHFVNAKGSRVWDMDGNEYLDLYARFGAMILGHGNKEYLQDLNDVMNRVFSVSHCDIDAEALEAINRYIPSAEMIRFGLSGTEIVQNALRIARAYTGRNKFVRFNNHYHGNADNIMGGKSKDKAHPVPKDYIGDTKGTAGRATGILQEQSFLIEWNDETALENLLVNHGDEIAAVIMEPVCVNGGSIMPKNGYLHKARELCNQYGIVLIFDEIITGFRMGLGGAQAKFGVIPDLTTLGKAMGGGGVPVAAIAGKKEFMQLLTNKTVIHAGTFNGYPLGTAAILSTIKILERDNGSVYEEMESKSAKLYNILTDIAASEQFPLICQGPVTCGAYHCCSKKLEYPSDYHPDIEIKDIILNSAFQKHGILVSSISRIYPNISLNDQDIQWFEDRAGKAISEAKELINELYQ